MAHYKLTRLQPEKHYLNISVVFQVENKDNMVFQLPSWRPGRYELGNFAKNVRDFNAVNEKGDILLVIKKSKDAWFVRTESCKSVIITYNYYSNELNAGSTYLDENLLYVNPINCFIYELGNLKEPSSIEIPVNENEEIAHTFELKDDCFYHAKSFHDLVDCPFIVSNKLQKQSYESYGVTFTVWFQGEVKPDWGKVITDFKKFTDYQMEKFGSIPVKEYHFMNLISTGTAYHGVEHFKSTVIQLGPSYDIFEKLYSELLGVSSHELYHVWNVKAIRPQEMFPYDYSRENYSKLGFVAEGVTTYMGDRILFESDVFDQGQYDKELLNYITRHFHNDGRRHLSVADSSLDTWLDGYVQGVPGRKTSIYVEGCLIAYICDMRIRKNTKGQNSLHDVMKKMYELTNQKVGYSETIYQETLELFAGVSFEDVFNDLVNGTKDFRPYLNEAFAYEGKELLENISNNNEACYGIKGISRQNEFEVKMVLENSAAYESGVVEGDVIYAVNDYSLNKDLDKWFKYFQEDEVELTIMRKSVLSKIKLFKPNNFQFYKYELSSK